MGNKKRQKIKWLCSAFLLSLLLHLSFFVISSIKLSKEDLILTLYNVSKKNNSANRANIKKNRVKKFSISTYPYEQRSIKGRLLKSPVKDENLALALENLKKKLICFGKIV
ncbi:hypothetical protein [Desulfothermus sp.]